MDEISKPNNMPPTVAMIATKYVLYTFGSFMMREQRWEDFYSKRRSILAAHLSQANGVSAAREAARVISTWEKRSI